MTVRFDDAALEYIRAEAKHAGVPLAQFVREAVLIRAVMRAAYRRAPGMPMDFARLAAEVEARSRV